MAYPQIPHHVVVRIAAQANADERTVRKVLQGQSVRGYVRERIDAALKAAGLLGEINQGTERKTVHG